MKETYEINRVYQVNPLDIVVDTSYQPSARDCDEYFESEDGQSLLEDAERNAIENPVHCFVNSDGDLELHTGYHRHGAAKIARNKKKDVTLPVMVINTPDISARFVSQITTNNQRPTTPLELGQAAIGYRDAIQKETGKAPTQAQIATIFGKQAPVISVAMAMAVSPTFLQDALANKKISAKEAQGLIKEGNKVAKKARSEWNKNNKAALEKAQEESEEALGALLEKGEAYVERKRTSSIREGYQKFREQVDSGEKQVGRGRATGSKNTPRSTESSSDSNSDSQSSSSTESSVNLDEDSQQIVFGSAVLLKDVINQFFSAAEEAYEMSFSEILEEIESYVQESAQTEAKA